MAYNSSKTDKIRVGIVSKFFKGESGEFSRNPKGLYQISTRNNILYFYDYEAALKTNIKLNGKPLVIVNRSDHWPSGEQNRPNTQIMLLLMRIFGQCQAKEDIAIIYCADGKKIDIGSLTLKHYIEGFTSTIYQISRSSIWWGGSMYLEEWRGSYNARLREAIKFIQHQGGKALKGIATNYSSLKEIQKEVKPGWLCMKETVLYWLCNGMAFSPEDDKFILKANNHLKYMYTGLGGVKDVECTSKERSHRDNLKFLRLARESTPLEEFPKYINDKNDSLKGLARERLRNAA